MPLAQGTRLGPYEIRSQIGAGGMGEVYRAIDTRLDRQVAIKILPSAFRGDPERSARFEREARLLATLNHPNIATIHGLEQAADQQFISMELVEGETLADRIRRGPVPLDEALSIAKQIAEGLEAAHEQGVVHRDLKPANVKVRSDGMVKVLDFGLAKALAPDVTSSAVLANSPTITSPVAMTGAGVLLGTAAYMSPEQARGKEVDKRADIWAFGCVLYEMLAGRQVAVGDTIADTVASLLGSGPDWSALPASVPPAVRGLLARCLDKDPRRRLRDIGEARLLLDQPRATEPATTSRVGWSTSQLGAFVLLAAGASLAVAFSLAAGDRAGTDRNGPVVRFAVMPPDGTTFGTQVGQFSISPDGTHLAMVAQGTRGTTIWVRPLQSLNARELPDTVGVLGNPFWSPDSTAIAFFADGKLKRTDVNGAVTQVVCDLPGRIGLFANTQGSWGPEGIIVFPGGTNQPIFQVAAGGGTPSPVTRLADAAETHSRPAILPDGRHFTYVASVGRDRGGVWLGAIGSDESRLLLPDVTSEAVYAQGHLLFVRGDVLMVQPFNLDRREFTGEARPLGEPARFGRNPNLSVSDTGALVYSSSLTPDRQFLWVDRDGRELSKVGEPEPWGNFDLSPDETKIVTSIGRDALSGDIWILDLARGGRSRLTTDRGRDGSPVWSPKGDQIAFTRENRWQAVLISATGGTETVLLERPQGGVILDDWSPDGHHLTFNSDPALMALPLAEPSKPFAFVQTASANLDESHFSPDSKWIAYNSNETGTWQTYLAPFPPNGQRQPISTEGGVEVRWRGDGKELFFLDLSGRMLAVDVIRLSNPPQLGPPRVLFDTGIIINPRLDHYAVSSDGQRFLLRRQVALGGRFPLVVVQSWPTLLKATKPGG